MSTEPKPALRRRLRALRDAIPLADRERWSADLTRRVFAFPELTEPVGVFCYVSVGSEVDTRPLLTALLAAGHTLAVPHLDADRRMTARVLASLADLRPAVPGVGYGIPSPPADAPILASPAVTIVPALAFTPQGHRLGYGAGHYDRWLADHPQTLSVGLCFPPLCLPTLPIEPHDQPVSRLLVPTSLAEKSA